MIRRPPRSTLFSLHDALPISHPVGPAGDDHFARLDVREQWWGARADGVGLGRADALDRHGVGVERADTAARDSALLGGTTEGPEARSDKELDAQTQQTHRGEQSRVNGTTCSLSLYTPVRSEEHTSELQSQSNLVCRLLLEKKKT